MKFKREKIAELVTLKIKTIRQKLIMFYIGIIVLPILFISFAFYWQISNVTKDEMIFSNQNNFDQSYEYLLSEFKNIDSYVYSFSINPELLMLLNTPVNELEVARQITLRDSVYKYFSYYNMGDILNINIYLNDGYIISNSSANFYSMDKIAQSTWYQELTRNNINSSWISSADYRGDESFDAFFKFEPSQLLSYVKTMRSLANFNQTVGIIRFDFDKSKIEKILSNSLSTKNSQTYLMSSDSEIVAISNDDQNLLITPSQILSSNIKMLSATSSWRKITVGHHTLLVGSRKFPNCDWFMINVVPLNEISDKSNITGANFVFMALLIILMASIFIYIITLSIATRISTIVRAMRSGNLNTIVVSHKNDEIDLLMENYNMMVNNIGALLKKQVDDQKILKNAEFAALQAQINPHFLYNTLEMINWYTWSEDKEATLKIVEALSEFFKLSLNQGLESITVKDELRLLSAYCQIQSMRYQDNIHFLFEIPNEVLPFRMPKIILQPIVENAIFHGVLCNPDKTGTISISAVLTDQDIVFSITDDGSGISADTLESINQGTLVNSTSAAGTGYGIKSVNERLKLLYGEDYALQYESRVGVGTTVVIKVPMEQNIG